MAFKNLAVSTVATAPSPATSGTSLVLTTGHGARMPATPFQLTIWPAATNPDPTTAEIVTVSARSTDTLTISRAQEGTPARTVIVGDQVAATITAAHVDTMNRRTIGLTVDGGGAAISTGLKGFIRVPWAGVISKVSMLADVSGSVVIDIWKDSYANFPPSVADTITASAKPSISAGVKSEDSTLTGWAKDLAAGDVLAFNVDSAATLTKLTLLLEVTVN